MVLIKKSRYLPHFLKYRKSNSNGSFPLSYKEDTVIQDIIKTNVAVSLQGHTTSSHPRVPPQGPTLRSHPKVLPQGPTPGSHLRVPPQGPTPESQVLGPTSGLQVLGPTLGSQSHFSGMLFFLHCVLICSFLIKISLFSIMVILIFCFDMYQIHTFSNNINDKGMITSHLMCVTSLY